MHPSSSQDLLLRAALDPSNQWIKALRAWEKVTDIDQLDPASIYLLPMLYCRMAKAQISSLNFAKIQGVYRHVWANNQRRIQLLDEVLHLCDQKGIPVLLTKGASLLFTHYPDKGMRYMADVDVVVSEENASFLTVDLLQRGYVFKENIDAEKTILNPVYRKIAHAVSFKHRSHGELDLHWHVLFDCCLDEANRFFWQGAREVQIRGYPTYHLHPADHLLVVIVHGFRWNQFPSFRGIVDAAQIVQSSSGNFDWKRFLNCAARWHLTALVKDTLHLLDRYGINIPQAVLQQLEAQRISRHYQREYRYRWMPRTKERKNRLIYRWFVYCRQYPGKSLLYRLIKFPQYLCDLYGISNPLNLPWVILQKLEM